MKILRGVAPARINDLGGWTDTWFATSGYVLSVSIQPGIECTLLARERDGIPTERVLVKIEDTGESFPVDLDRPAFEHNPLVEAVIFSEGIPECVDMEISIHSDMPPGAGTGTSASLAVALLGTLRMLKGADISPATLWKEAHRIETGVLGLESGIQDQICASYGGICFIEIPRYPAANISRVNLGEELIEKLDRMLVLVFLGKAHQSSEVHRCVIEDLKVRSMDSQELEILRNTALKGLQALLLGDLQAYGSMMIENNEAQRSLHPDLIPEEADLVVEIARRSDALGWKVNGAGGSGGSMTVLLPDDPCKIKKFKEDIESLRASHERAGRIQIVGTRIDRKGFTVEVLDDKRM